jgi:hypothetical protein
MLRHLRLAITLGALASCVGVSVATAVAVFRQGFSEMSENLPIASPGSVPPPPPSLSAEGELREIIISQDLTKAPRQRQLAIAGQLEALARARRDWRGVNDGLTPQQRKRAEENLFELLRVWFLAKADQYAALDQSRQTAFLDGLIDTALTMAQTLGPQAMSIGSTKAAAKVGGKTRSADLQAAFGQLLVEWQAKTSPEEVARGVALYVALRERAKSRAVKKEPAK